MDLKRNFRKHGTGWPCSYIYFTELVNSTTAQQGHSQRAWWWATLMTYDGANVVAKGSPVAPARRYGATHSMSSAGSLTLN